MQNIEQILKQLKKIGPSEEYKKQSLRLILATSQNPSKIAILKVYDLFKYGAALGLTGLLILISLSSIVSSLNIKFLSPVLLSNLDEEKIQKEAGQVDIKITLSEAKYYSDSINKVAIALDETAKNGEASHLNSLILEKEMRELNINKENGKSLDELLNKLTM